jgi:hypothetical protein
VLARLGEDALTRTNVAGSDFVLNLKDNGFAQSAAANGATLMHSDASVYTIYTRSSQVLGAQYASGGQILIKFLLNGR